MSSLRIDSSGNGATGMVHASLRHEAPVNANALTTTSRTANGPTPTAGKHDAAEVGREFEAIFVRTILRSSGMASGSDSYSDLSIDAVARSVTSGKGLGLAETIRHALERSDLKVPR